MQKTKSFTVEAINGPDYQANSILKQMYSALLDKGDLSVFEQSIFQAIEDAYKTNNQEGRLTELLDYLIKGLKKDPQTSRDHELNLLIKNALVSIIKKNEHESSFEDKVAEIAYAMSNMDFSLRLPLSDIENQSEKNDFVAICLNAANEELQTCSISTEIGEILLSTPKHHGIIVTDTNGQLKFVSKNLKATLFSTEKVKVGTSINDLRSINFENIGDNTWTIIPKNTNSKDTPTFKVKKTKNHEYLTYEFDLDSST